MTLKPPRVRKGRREEKTDLARRHQSHWFRARLCAKNEAPEEEADFRGFVRNDMVIFWRGYLKKGVFTLVPIEYPLSTLPGHRPGEQVRTRPQPSVLPISTFFFQCLI